jgi:type II secretion system protein C
VVWPADEPKRVPIGSQGATDIMTKWTYIFATLCLSLTAVSRANDVVKKEDSELGFAIVGAIVQKTSANNVALIKEDSGSVKAVKKDFIIMDKYKVIAVSENSIEAIDRNGQRYFVYHGKFMEDSAAKTAANQKMNLAPDRYQEDGFERKGGKIAVSASYRDKMVKDDLAKVLMQATAEPYLENGAIAGFRMSQIDEGSIYSKAGLQDGDVITSINGSELNNVAASISLLRSLKGADHIDIDLKRGGQTQKVTIDVR